MTVAISVNGVLIAMTLANTSGMCSDLIVTSLPRQYVGRDTIESLRQSLANSFVSNMGQYRMRDTSSTNERSYSTKECAQI